MYEFVVGLVFILLAWKIYERGTQDGRLQMQMETDAYHQGRQDMQDEVDRDIQEVSDRYAQWEERLPGECPLPPEKGKLN